MKTCFVICPIGDIGDNIRVAADDFIKYIVEPCTIAFGFDLPLRADRLPDPGSITSQINRLLLDADLVIADLTGANSNVYYELSLRHAIGKPAIHMALGGTKLSFDIADNRTIFYTMHARHVEQVKELLTNQIRYVQDVNYKARNPIVDAVGLIKLESSTEPTQRLIATVLGGVETLQRDVLSLKTDVSQMKSHNSYAGILSTLAAGNAPFSLGGAAFASGGSLFASGGSLGPSQALTPLSELPNPVLNALRELSNDEEKQK